MAIHEPEIPSAIKDVFDRTKTHLRELSEGVLEDRSGWDTDDLKVAGQHHIYILGIPSLQSGKNLADAKPVAWQLLARHQSTGVAVTLEVGEKSPGIPAVGLATVSWGPAAEKPVKAAEILRQMEAANSPFTNQDFELRILRLPTLHIETIWLHATTGQGDLVFPFLSFEEWVDKPFGTDAYIKTLQGMAGTVDQRSPIKKVITVYGKDKIHA